MENIYNAIQNVYNMDKTTWQEVLAELYNLVFKVENKFDLFENKFGVLLGEEVTIELKKMYDDGSLAALINDKLLKDIKTEFSEKLDTNVRKLDEKKANKEDVARISSGTPLFANSVSEMTDNTRNYVNTTDGYVYTYNGTKFEKSNVKYQSTGLSDKQVTTKNLSDDIRISPNALINLDKNLIDINYLNNPKSFISWFNNTSTTITEDNMNKINGFKTINIQSNSSSTHWNISIPISYTKQGKLTFSYLRKASVLNGQNVNAVDNNEKWYGGSYIVIENYYKGWDLVKYTITINTNITTIKFYIGNYNGENNYNVGLFSLVEGEYKDILPKWSLQDLSEDLQSLIVKNEIGVNTLDVLNYDMLLPKKIFMINEEPLRLYKKNIVVNTDNIRDLELSVISYTDDDFWNNSKQPYVEYINDKLELKSDNIMGKKIKFNLVGNDLKTRLGKEVEVVSRSKSEVSGKSIIVNMFGDSTSQNGLTYAVNKLLSHYVTRKLIGTKIVNGTPAEARGGWLYQQYIGYRTTYSHNDLPINEVDYPNFLKVATDEDKTNKGDWCFTRTGSSREKTYNEIVSEGGNTSQNFYIFDYSHYLQINGFENPDFVTLGMGINDYWKYPNDATELCEKALDIIIRQIHEASPTTKFILQPFPTKGSNDVKVEWFKKCLELETYFRDTVGVDVEIVAEHISQNKDLFFPTTITELDEKVTNKEVISDDIHTTYAGYSEGARPIVYCMINKID